MTYAITSQIYCQIRYEKSHTSIKNCETNKNSYQYLVKFGDQLTIYKLIWSYWADSNRRPADYESAALPTEPQ